MEVIGLYSGCIIEIIPSALERTVYYWDYYQIHAISGSLSLHDLICIKISYIQSFISYYIGGDFFGSRSKLYDDPSYQGLPNIRTLTNESSIIGIIENRGTFEHSSLQIIIGMWVDDRTLRLTIEHYGPIFE